MVTKYSVKWTIEAKNDLRSIMEYIVAVESKERALYVISAIRKKANQTSDFPLKHPKELNINNDNIRYAIQWSYKIVLEIKKDTIRILSIFHTAQNPDKLIKYE